MSTPFKNVRIVDLLGGLTAGYCCKLFTDAGADVILAEDKEPDRMRSWRTEERTPDEDSALFRFLRHGQKSATGNVEEWIRSADLVVVGRDGPDPSHLRSLRPGIVVLAISPYGLKGPWRDHASNEFTLQADSGGIATRGLPWRTPFALGGSTGEWFAATTAAVAAAAALKRARESGHGEVIDFSKAEAYSTCMTNFAGMEFGSDIPDAFDHPARSLETPSIEPTSDGYIGFNTNTRQQWEDFCLVIERQDLIEKYALGPDRFADWDTWTKIVSDHTSTKTITELEEFASLLRIPVAPVCNGKTVQEVNHFAERGVYKDSPDKKFKMPRRTWRINGEDPPQTRPAPVLGDAGSPDDREPIHSSEPTSKPPLPLEGLTVLDCTAWWAGPSSTMMLATLGAEVIHVESTRHPDGMRMYVGKAAGTDRWWEKGWLFRGTNSNKLGLTLDLSSERGRELFLDLAATADIVVENYTPRVFENFGFSWELLQGKNPQLIFVRMPAFGLDGPWRDRPGFAQTMEQASGLAWVTGFPDDQPRIQRGPCDPNAGMHAAFAMIAALAHRDATGQGCFVESPMVESALNVAAEQVIEWSSYGHLLERTGNRSDNAVPQGIYPCGEKETWIALSVETESQWQALTEVLGCPDLAGLTASERRQRHDELDELITNWTKDKVDEDAAASLLEVGSPSAIVRDPRRSLDHPQFTHRGFVEQPEHAVLGAMPTPGMPFRFASVEKWLRSAAPTLGEHNDQILARIGRTEAELTELTEAGVIGQSLTI